MKDVADLVISNGTGIEEISFRTVDYSDGPLNVILEDPRQPKGKHVYLFQRLIDPFSERPDHYVSQMILRGLIDDKITVEDIAGILNTNIGDHLRKYARDGSKGIRTELVQEVIDRSESCLTGFRGTSHEIDNDPRIHYPLEGLMRRMIHRMGYIPQMEEATVVAEGLMQYGAKSVTLVVPYLEGRSDKDQYRGEVNLSRKWAKDFRAHGIRSIVTWRAHSKAQMGFYSKSGVGFTEIYESQKQRARLAQVTADYIIGHYGSHKIKKDLIVIGPDRGAKDEAIAFAGELEKILNKIPVLKEMGGSDYQVPIIIMKKDRGGRISEIANMAVEEWHNLSQDTNLSDKLYVYRDDMIDTVGTNHRALITLGIMAKSGYRKIGQGSAILVVDNPVLSMPGPESLQKIKETGAFEILISPRTVEPPIREDQYQRMIQYLDIIGPFANEILRRERC